MPALQKRLSLLSNLPLQHGKLMVRHPTAGRNAAVAEPELDLLTPFSSMDMGRLAPIGAVE
jgi:hypothetical protein